MKKGKFAKRGIATKTMMIALAVMMVFGCTIGGTIAWLMDQTAAVTNTFTVGDVDITLKETKILQWNNDEPQYDNAPAENVANAYKLIPGNTYKKDPVVEVVATSEDCYLFVKFEETEDAKTYLTYNSLLTAENDWTRGTGGEGEIPENVWYREVKKSDTKKSWYLLAGNDVYANGCITVNAETVTKESMNEAAEQSLKYTAYAAQMANLTVEEAWAQVSN